MFADVRVDIYGFFSEIGIFVREIITLLGSSKSIIPFNQAL